VRLYELTAVYEHLLLLAENADSDSDVLAELEHIEHAIEEKGAGIAAVLANLDADAQACATEEKRLAARRARFERNAESLRRYVHVQMEGRGIQRIAAGTFSFALKRCPPSVEVIDEARVPEGFKRKKQSEAVDKAAVLAAWREHGECVPGTRIVDDRTRLEIK
jgi:hypothetical protein